jgi:hypothetical protein
MPVFRDFPLAAGIPPISLKLSKELKPELS